MYDLLIGTKYSRVKAVRQLTVTCSNSTIETLGKGVKYVQSWQ